MSLNVEIITGLATIVSSFSALGTVIFLTKQYKDSKFMDAKHFWYRKYALNDGLEDYNLCFERILDVSSDEKLSFPKKLLGLKEEFHNLRIFFYNIEFFDATLHSKLENFINLCEEEFMVNQDMSPEEILKIKNIILKSLYEYELNDYKNFNIKYIL